MSKICELPGCGKKARRRFCSNKHKDRYHNLNNPRGKFAHLADGFGADDHEHSANITMDTEDTFHPFDSYSLGQE